MCWRMPCTTAPRYSKVCAPTRRRTGPIIFRLKDHTRRLFDSARIYRMDIPYSSDDINDACKEIVIGQRPEQGRLPASLRLPRLRRNRRRAQESAAHRNDCGRLSNGVRISVPKAWRKASTSAFRPGSGSRPTPFRRWARPPAITCPASSSAWKPSAWASPKASVSASMARVSEGAGENLFVDSRWRDLYAGRRQFHAARHHPRHRHDPGARAWLRSARTDDSARVAVHRRRNVLHRHCCRSHAGPFGGSHQVGAGKRGPITEALQTAFFGLFTGKTADKWGWLRGMQRNRLSTVSTLGTPRRWPR